MSRTVDVLNAAFKRDPVALHTLISNRVPCNEALVNDPYMVVDNVRVLPQTPGYFVVGLLGVLNGVLVANELPRVAARFEPAPGMEDHLVLLGFQDYGLALQQAEIQPIPDDGEPAWLTALDAATPDAITLTQLQRLEIVEYVRRLRTAAYDVVRPLANVLQATSGKDGDQTDRVYAWYEIEPLQAAVRGTPSTPV